jgi:hypothetical protein
VRREVPGERDDSLIPRHRAEVLPLGTSARQTATAGLKARRLLATCRELEFLYERGRAAYSAEYVARVARAARARVSAGAPGRRLDDEVMGSALPSEPRHPPQP